MKAVILCGGRGTRLGDRGISVPKALMPIGGKPVIWHILSLYASFGITDFVLCTGYLGETIKRWFDENQTDWNVSIVDTGLDTNTGGRLLCAKDMIGDGAFCATYGDGLADVNISDLLAYHDEHRKVATLTAVHPRSNFGIMNVGDDGNVEGFIEKPLMDDWVNGGFFVFDRRIFDYLEADSTLEREPFEKLCEDGEMRAFFHDGFWKCMDTHKDNLEFEELWKSGAPWRI